MNLVEREQTERHVRTICLVILTIIACGVAMHMLRTVVVPFLLALCFTFCLTPIVGWFREKLRFPNWAALVATAVIALVVLALLGLLVVASVVSITQNLSEYQQRIAQLAQQAAAYMHLEKLSIRPDPETGHFLWFSPETQRQLLLSVAGETTSILSFGSLVALFMLFLLLGSKPHLGAQEGLLGDIQRRVQRYLLELFFLSAITGILVGSTLEVLGVPFAMVFGFLTFLLNFIPSLGAIIAVLLPLPIILLSPDMSLTEQVLAVVLPSVIQGVIGAIIQPRVQSASLNVHPVVIVLALLFFSMIWGVIGAFLAVPLVGVLKIIFDRVPYTQPLGEALAGNLERFAGLGSTATSSKKE